MIRMYVATEVTTPAGQNNNDFHTECLLTCLSRIAIVSDSYSYIMPRTEGLLPSKCFS